MKRMKKTLAAILAMSICAVSTFPIYASAMVQNKYATGKFEDVIAEKFGSDCITEYYPTNSFERTAIVLKKNAAPVLLTETYHGITVTVKEGSDLSTNGADYGITATNTIVKKDSAHYFFDLRESTNRQQIYDKIKANSNVLSIDESYSITTPKPGLWSVRCIYFEKTSDNITEESLIAKFPNLKLHTPTDPDDMFTKAPDGQISLELTDKLPGALGYTLSEDAYNDFKALKNSGLKYRLNWVVATTTNDPADTYESYSNVYSVANTTESMLKNVINEKLGSDNFSQFYTPNNFQTTAIALAKNATPLFLTETYNGATVTVKEGSELSTSSADYGITASNVIVKKDSAHYFFDLRESANRQQIYDKIKADSNVLSIDESYSVTTPKYGNWKSQYIYFYKTQFVYFDKNSENITEESLIAQFPNLKLHKPTDPTSIYAKAPDGQISLEFSETLPGTSENTLSEEAYNDFKALKNSGLKYTLQWTENAMTEDPVQISNPSVNVYSAENTTTNTVIYGDANNDGNVDISDVVAVRRYTLNSTLYALSADGQKSSDVQGDGDGINAQDAVAIQQFVLGAINSLPVKN
ncbi:MAG: dockerin type I repeat-containing protein [Ruminococcus sp.]|jgi:L-lactate utilization protein LutC|nr:dockerin type I repeat-containing protein [Ruminococcus sp.]